MRPRALNGRCPGGTAQNRLPMLFNIRAAPSFVHSLSAAGQVGGQGRAASQCKKYQDGSAPTRAQEQIQMITAVTGRATPKAPPIINANADNKFASACT